MYGIFFITMLCGFGGLAFMATGKARIIAVLLWIVNFLIFYKGGK